MEQLVRLGDVCTVVSGSTPKTSVDEYWNGDVKWITPAELDADSYYIHDSVKHITELGRTKTGLSYMPVGTVILSSRAPIGKTAILGCEMCCNQGFKNLICTDRIFNEYLYHFLRAKTNYLNSLGRGATFKELSKGIVENVLIPLPAIEEQHHIADLFASVEELIQTKKQQLDLFDELVKSRFIELFGDPVDNPKTYLVKSLQELIDMGYITYHLDGNHGGDYPRSEEFVDSGVPYIGANSIVNGEIDFSMAKFLTVERAGKLRKGIAQNNDVLFAHNATVGPTVVLKTTEPKVILSTSLTAYRCNQSELLPNYLKAYMQSDGFVRQYSGEMKQTTRNQVPITAQKKYLFLVPPIVEQEQFSTFVEQTDKSKLAVQQSIAELEELKKSLMQKYFG